MCSHRMDIEKVPGKASVMNRQSWLLNLSLLKTHPAFRAVFLARFISIVSLGLLGVAVPVQIQMMTQSTWQVGFVSNVDRQRNVYWSDGGRGAGRPL